MKGSGYMKLWHLIVIGMLCLIALVAVTDQKLVFAEQNTTWDSLYKQGVTSYRSGDFLKSAQALKSSLIPVTKNRNGQFDEMRSLAMLLLVYHQSNVKGEEIRTFKQLFALLPSSTSEILLPSDLLDVLREYKSMSADDEMSSFSRQLDGRIPELCQPPEMIETVVSNEVVGLSNYTKECMRLIDKTWQRTPGDDKIAIDLSLNRDGSIFRARTAKSSGIPELDARALNTVRNIKYPAFPSHAKWPGASMIVRFGKLGNDG